VQIVLLFRQHRHDPVRLLSECVQVRMVVFRQLGANGGGQLPDEQHGEELRLFLARFHQLQHLGQQIDGAPGAESIHVEQEL